MIIKIFPPQGICEKGNRQNQEDCLWPQVVMASAEDRLFVLCDGMGGHEHGEVASQLVCSVLPAYLQEHWQHDEPLSDDVLRDALDEVFRRINVFYDGSQRQMGTTLTLLCVHRGGITMAHIGDSRIYHVRPGEKQILYKSRDHSLVYDLFMAGEITQEEMATNSHKNVITRAIMPGLERQPRMDIAHTTDIQPDDYFFLCSDGMLEQITDLQLVGLLSSDKSNDEKRSFLVKSTQNNSDNHSAWFIQVEQVQREPDDGQQLHNENTVRCNALLLERAVAKVQPQSFWQRVKKRFFD